MSDALALEPEGGLPVGWASLNLGEVRRLKSESFNPSGHQGEVFELYSVPSHETGKPEVVDAAKIGSNKQFVHSGDVLISKINPRLNRTWLVPLMGEHTQIGSTEWVVFPSNEAITGKLLSYILQDVRLRDFLCQNSSGVGGSLTRVRPDIFDNITIGLPPLNEQRRIVEKIENLFAELDKGEESLRTAKARAGLYRQSLLKHAFEGHLTADWRAANPDKLEDPKTLLTRIQDERAVRYKQALDDWQSELEKWRDEGEEGKKPAKPKRPADISVDDFDPELLPELPTEWVLQHLGNLNVGVFDGPFGSNLKTSDYTDSGVQVIRLENIGYGNFITSKESFVSPEKYETIKKHTVFPRDIVFSSFVTDGIRSALVPSSVPFAVNKADCFAVQFFGATVSNEYVAHFLQSRWAYKAVEGLIHGVGRPRINTTQLKEIQVPICSPAEQDEIVKQLEAKLSIIEASEKQMDEQLARSKALRQSILKRAFAGELVDQDPNDEPASELLERIKAEKAEAELAAKRDRKTKPVRKPKNRRPKMTDLIEVLKKEGDWVSASKAAQGLGIADGTPSDDVEAFYRQLKERIEANEIEVERRGDEDWLRLAKVEAT